MGESARAWCVATMVCVIGHCLSSPVAAQTSGDPNPGAITLTGSMDASNAYLFRGIPQDDTGLILWPAADLGVMLRSGGGTVRSVTANVGTWNESSHGSHRARRSQRQAVVRVGFLGQRGRGVRGRRERGGNLHRIHEPGWRRFSSVKELSLKASAGVHGTNPYALVAFELEGQADGGAVEGRYLELGAAPSRGLAGLIVAVPVKVGLSLDGYYEGLRGDERFGFFSVGGNVTVPFTSDRSRFGRWNVHGGADYVRLGDSNALRLDRIPRSSFRQASGFLTSSCRPAGRSACVIRP